MFDLSRQLPPPTPLRQGMLIHYQWGEQKFEIVAIACSIRTVFWQETGADVVWLHCKAIQLIEIKPGGLGHTMNVLIPAHYVTRAEPGQTFRVTRSEPSRDIGIYPPNQPAPANPVPLADLERLIAGLVDVSLN